MRTVLFLLIPFFANSACAQVLRDVRSDLIESVPTVQVYDLGATADSRPAIVIAREVVDGWNFLYLAITETEFALCLEGKREAEKVTITGFRLAHIIASNPSHIEYVPCNGGTYVGTAHNHPSTGYPGWDPCHQSALDLRSFRKDKKAQVDIIICGRDRFVWVSKKDDTAPRLWQAAAGAPLKR